MKNIDDVLEYLTKQREMNKVSLNPEKQVDFKELARERRLDNKHRRTLVDARIRESSDPSYRVTPDEEFVCEECGKPLSKDDEYHVKWGTCGTYCYGKMVGVYF